MKKITKTYEKEGYQSIDGITFEDKEECEKYEQSAVCAVLAKINGFFVENPLEDNDNDCVYKFIVPENENDIYNLNHFWSIPRTLNENDKCPFNSDDISKPILLGFRYSSNNLEWVWFYRLNEVVEKLTNNTFTLICK